MLPEVFTVETQDGNLRSILGVFGTLTSAIEAAIEVLDGAADRRGAEHVELTGPAVTSGAVRFDLSAHGYCTFYHLSDGDRSSTIRRFDLE